MSHDVNFVDLLQPVRLHPQQFQRESSYYDKLRIGYVRKFHVQQMRSHR